MHIGFDISQTGADKAGCGYFAHALINAMLELAPEHRFSSAPPQIARAAKPTATCVLNLPAYMYQATILTETGIHMGNVG